MSQLVANNSLSHNTLRHYEVVHGKSLPLNGATPGVRDDGYDLTIKGRRSRSRWDTTHIRAIRAATLSAVVAVAILRVWYCLLLPANTGDTLRHLVYGQLALQRGLGVASLPLAKISADFARVSWPDVSFNYPILALLFDIAMAWIWPSLFAMKLVLTLIEGANALLIWRWLGQKWIAVLYWISPISIWWASREGQFEPLQNLFCILAIGLFIRRRTPAWLLLALAIQVKLFAVFLLPLFMIGSRRRGDLAKGVGVFALGLLPTLIASFYYDVAGNFSRSFDLYFNPYYFNFLNRSIFVWVPVWLIFCNQIVSDAAVVALIALAWRSGRWASYSAGWVSWPRSSWPRTSSSGI